MSKRIDCIAFHEAGHAIACILAGTKFKHVTIKPKAGKEKQEQSLGQIVFQDSVPDEEWDKYSIMNPSEFSNFFKRDFFQLAGFIAETMYRQRSNYKGSLREFRQWAGSSLNKLPEKLSSKYQSFLLEYTFQVLQTDSNWSNKAAVALALVDHETLSYDQVCEVLEQNERNQYLFYKKNLTYIY